MSRKVSSAFESNRSSASFAARIDLSIMPVKIASNLSPAASRLSRVASRLVSAETLGVSDAIWEAAVSTITARSGRSEEHTSELQSLMRISDAVFCLKKKQKQIVKM